MHLYISATHIASDRSKSGHGAEIDSAAQNASATPRAPASRGGNQGRPGPTASTTALSQYCCPVHDVGSGNG